VAPLLSTLYRDTEAACLKKPTDRCAGDAVSLGDLAQALPSIAVLKDSTPVDVERPPADMPALQAGAAHPCPHPFDDEIPFEFGDSSDDDNDGPA